LRTLSAPKGIMRCGLDRSDRPHQPAPLGDVLLVPTSDPGWLLTEDGVAVETPAAALCPGEPSG
jgi:hypothetical protein